MKKQNPELILLLPVFRGGAMFQRCLRSIVPCESYFDRIFISVNGASPNEDVLAIRNSGLKINKISMLITNRDLSPVQHNVWLCNQLRQQLDPDDRIVFLAHDDELIPESFQEWFSLFHKYGERVAWLGDYALVKDQFHMTESQVEVAKSIPVEAYKRPVTLIEWLVHNEHNPQGYVYTNMSGMSVPFRALDDISGYWRRTFGKIGARFEYMLVSHRSIEGIMGSANPIARIHLHPGQDGRNVPSIDYPKDEIRYCFWLLINAKSWREFWWVFKSRWGIKGILSSIRLIVAHVRRRLKTYVFGDSK